MRELFQWEKYERGRYEKQASQGGSWEGEVHRPHVYVERWSVEKAQRGPSQRALLPKFSQRTYCCRRPHSAFVNGTHVMDMIHKLFSRIVAE